MPQGYVIESLANNGAKSTNSIITEIGASNPASIYDFTNNSVGISYQYDSKIDEAWITEFGHSRVLNFIPQSVGLVIPKNNWHFCIAFNQVYNNEIDYGKLEPTLVWNNPQGFTNTGVINPKRNELVLKTSVIVSYNKNNFIRKDDKLTVGLQVNYNYLKFEMSISDDDKLSESSNALNFAPGIMYEFSGNTQLKSRVGLYYESKLDLSKTFSNDSSPIKIISILPHKLHLGVYHPCGENWSYAANITYLFWNDVNENFKDQTELSANAGYKFSKNLEIKFGFFSTDRKYIDFPPEFNNLTAICLILSAKYKIDKFSFDITVADSHSTSDEWRKQTMLKFGTGYTF